MCCCAAVSKRGIAAGAGNRTWRDDLAASSRLHRTRIPTRDVWSGEPLEKRNRFGGYGLLSASTEETCYHHQENGIKSRQDFDELGICCLTQFWQRILRLWDCMIALDTGANVDIYIVQGTP